MNTYVLEKWLVDLIARDRLDIFYHSKMFKKLKHNIFKEFHYECQCCKEEGHLTLLTERDPLHHVKEVKKFPRLALSRYYIDEHGNKKLNLIPLCFKCHNKVHNRFQKASKFINEEKW